MTPIIKPKAPYLKNHKSQFPINQMLKDEIEKNIFKYTKGFKTKNSN
jgi:hypothetical protein